MKKNDVDPRNDTDKKYACSRCRGMMVEDWVFTDEGEIAMVRCIRCGNSLDSLILSNRRKGISSSEDKGRKRTRKKSPGLAKPFAA
ncbi:MAG: hypothetical protein EPO39_14670 [Candidatus Manganitrophaceae bacterium]|nr:MAG: hypothetical protein EPO39_14670 [Candidatus Manganitrophaceae bacterium]